MSEKDTNRGSSAVAAPAKMKPAPKPLKSPPRRDKLPPYKVVLHNDSVNSMEDAVDAIVAITPLSFEVAVRRMLEAHIRGRSLLLTTHKERAELYRDQFVSRKFTVTVDRA